MYKGLGARLARLVPTLVIVKPVVPERKVVEVLAKENGGSVDVRGAFYLSVCSR